MQTIILIIKILISSFLNKICNTHTYLTLTKIKEAVLAATDNNKELKKKNKNRKYNFSCRTESEDKYFTYNKSIYLKNNCYNIFLI